MIKNDLFDTQEKINNAITDFRGLLEHPGWKLFVKVLDANIEVVSRQILVGLEGETKESIDRLRDKHKVYTEARNTPQDLIEKFEAGETENINPDPYDTVADEKQSVVDTEAKKT